MHGEGGPFGYVFDGVRMTVTHLPTGRAAFSGLAQEALSAFCYCAIRAPHFGAELEFGDQLPSEEKVALSEAVDWCTDAKPILSWKVAPCAGCAAWQEVRRRCVDAEACPGCGAQPSGDEWVFLWRLNVNATEAALRVGRLSEARQWLSALLKQVDHRLAQHQPEQAVEDGAE